MAYKLLYTKEAQKDLKEFKKPGNKALLKKVASLLQEIQEHPFEGTGKPEELKYELTGLWSRRINREHRIVYKVEDEIITVTILSLKGHYSNFKRWSFLLQKTMPYTPYRLWNLKTLEKVILKQVIEFKLPEDIKELVLVAVIDSPWNPLLEYDGCTVVQDKLHPYLPYFVHD